MCVCVCVCVCMCVVVGCGVCVAGPSQLSQFMGKGGGLWSSLLFSPSMSPDLGAPEGWECGVSPVHLPRKGLVVVPLA